jgi:DNA-directed RNA polymerase subunit M/transcription elongation factor TFIIS
METPTIIRAATLTAEEKKFRQCRRKLFEFAERSSLAGDARKIEYEMAVRAAGNMMLYTEMATSLIRKIKNGMEEEETCEEDNLVQEETNISKMFQTVTVEVTDSRYALSVCGNCKSTNVRNEAMQVRSADEGMSVFSTCLDCGHKWVQR